MGGRGSSGSRGSGKGGDSVEKRLSKYFDETRISSSNDAISRGQAGMLYRGIKNGDLKASKNSISIMYERYTGSPRRTTDSSSVDVANKLRVAVTAAANNDWKAAQRQFDRAMDAHHSYFREIYFPDDR